MNHVEMMTAVENPRVAVVPPSSVRKGMTGNAGKLLMVMLIKVGTWICISRDS